MSPEEKWDALTLSQQTAIDTYLWTKFAVTRTARGDVGWERAWATVKLVKREEVLRKQPTMGEILEAYIKNQPESTVFNYEKKGTLFEGRITEELGLIEKFVSNWQSINYRQHTTHTAHAKKESTRHAKAASPNPKEKKPTYREFLIQQALAEEAALPPEQRSQLPKSFLR